MDSEAPKREQFEDDVLLDGEEEPNEILGVPPQSSESVWLVKIPKSLMETWSAVKGDPVHLATVRVHLADQNSGQQKVSLLLPENAQYDIGDENTEFELDITNQAVNGQYVLADRPNERSANKRARSTHIAGKIKHAAALKPVMNSAYEAKLRKRQREANRPKKTIMMLDDRQPSASGSNLKMIQSGALQTSAGFGAVKKATKAGDKPVFERAARISRDELLDQLFGLFTPAQPFWSMKELRKRTAQPEAYLKEVLGEIADFHKSGPQTNTFSLKAEYAAVAGGGSGGAAGTSLQMPGSSSAKAEDIEVDEDDDDDDEEMEEVA